MYLLVLVQFPQIFTDFGLAGVPGEVLEARSLRTT